MIDSGDLRRQLPKEWTAVLLCLTVDELREVTHTYSIAIGCYSPFTRKFRLDLFHSQMLKKVVR